MKINQPILKFIWHTAIYLAVSLAAATGLLRMGMLVFGRNHSYPPDAVPPAPVALVLGAGLNRDGTPGVVLQDRVRMAVELYETGKVKKILMSGDNSTDYYDEPTAMGDFAIALGVPAEDIVLDYAGRRTYDSCYRAGAIFGVEKVIVVTQYYHLHRALFLCDALGLDAAGVAADESVYPRSRYTAWRVREVLASIKACWDIWIAKPLPILGEREPIFQ
jgi:vancomycin permeability regulator SanA